MLPRLSLLQPHKPFSVLQAACFYRRASAHASFSPECWSLNVLKAHSHPLFNSVLRYLIREVFVDHPFYENNLPCSITFSQRYYFSWHLLLAALIHFSQTCLPPLPLEHKLCESSLCYLPEQLHSWQHLARRRLSFSYFIFLFHEWINSNWMKWSFIRWEKRNFLSQLVSSEHGFELGSN